MSHINQIVMSGRLTANPILRGQDGSVVVLPIASNRQFQRNGEWQNDVCFIDATAFSHNATKCQKLAEGDEVTVTGRLELNTFEANDGSKRRVIRIVASQVESPVFLPRWMRKATDGTFEAAPVTEPVGVGVFSEADGVEDDIPF